MFFFAYMSSAFLGRTCVGSITCRIERRLGGKSVNILTLGVLAPYRRRGIGNHLISYYFLSLNVFDELVSLEDRGNHAIS